MVETLRLRKRKFKLLKSKYANKIILKILEGMTPPKIFKYFNRSYDDFDISLSSIYRFKNEMIIKDGKGLYLKANYEKYFEQDLSENDNLSENFSENKLKKCKKVKEDTTTTPYAVNKDDEDDFITINDKYIEKLIAEGMIGVAVGINLLDNLIKKAMKIKIDINKIKSMIEDLDVKEESTRAKLFIDLGFLEAEMLKIGLKATKEENKLFKNQLEYLMGKSIESDKIKGIEKLNVYKEINDLTKEIQMKRVEKE